MALRSVSSPISNSRITTPTCASRRKTPVSGSPGAVGMILSAPAPSTMPTTSSPSTAGWPSRSTSSPAILAATTTTARKGKKRTTGRSPAAPSSSGRSAARASGLQRLVGSRMELEGVVEQRQVDRLAVSRLNADFPRRESPADIDVLGGVLGDADILDGRLEAAADRAVVERRGDPRLRLHLVEESVVAEVDLADVHPVVEQPHEDEQRDEAPGGAGAAPPAERARYHWDCAPSTISVTSF